VGWTHDGSPSKIARPDVPPALDLVPVRLGEQHSLGESSLVQTRSFVVLVTLHDPEVDTKERKGSVSELDGVPLSPPACQVRRARADLARLS
jgi:hypothetical protein